MQIYLRGDFMKLGVIGAGITGLVSAYEAGKGGIDVTVLEGSSETGGIAGAFNLNGVSLEKYYHHFFKSDIYINKLLKELGMEDKMLWLKSSMGFFIDNKLYDFGTPVSLLKFKPLKPMDKMRFGIATLKMLGANDYKDFENITASSWIQANAGRKVYEKVWKPLLITKFQDQFENVSMAWFWGKIKLRGTSNEKGREVLGYIDGSTGNLIRRLEEEIAVRGSKIFLNCHVNHIDKKDVFQVNTSRGMFSFDRIICTSPMPEFIRIAKNILPADYTAREDEIKYTAVTCMILILDRQFTKYYWLNIGDAAIPFGGLIEHTNLLGCERYGGDHILYISNYVFEDSIYCKMDADEMLDKYIPYLKSINPSFEKSWVKNKFLFKDRYAQPVIKTGYSKIKPGFETPVKGLYISNMCCIYPEDRGMNYAVRDGMGVSGMLLRGENIGR